MNRKKTAFFTGLVIFALVAASIGCTLFWPRAELIRFDVKTAEAAEKPFSIQPYASALKFVDEKGLVDYAGLKAASGDLDAFAASLAVLKPETVKAWSEKEKIAFWINAYNALTLQVILKN
jgi:hypothetical protein